MEGVRQADLLEPRIVCKFSACQRYRYTWELIWDPALPPVAFIGLNPSTADENSPDPTVRRCIAYSKAWGHGGLIMLNLFAWRATEPRDMKARDDPVGPDNDWWLRDQVSSVNAKSGGVIAVWGTHGTYRGRDVEVIGLLRGFPLHYLKLTKDGCPGHPLYLKGDLKPVRWV